jgi:hypothetical protein
MRLNLNRIMNQVGFDLISRGRKYKIDSTIAIGVFIVVSELLYAYEVCLVQILLYILHASYSYDFVYSLSWSI